MTSQQAETVKKRQNARLIAAAPDLLALVRAHSLTYPHDEYEKKIAAVLARVEGEDENHANHT